MTARSIPVACSRGRQALDLDVVGLVAVLAQPRRIGRHKGKALDRPLQRNRLIRRIEVKWDGAECGASSQLPRVRNRRRC